MDVGCCDFSFLFTFMHFGLLLEVLHVSGVPIGQLACKNGAFQNQSCWNCAHCETVAKTTICNLVSSYTVYYGISVFVCDRKRGKCIKKTFHDATETKQ